MLLRGRLPQKQEQNPLVQAKACGRATEPPRVPPGHEPEVLAEEHEPRDVVRHGEMALVHARAVEDPARRVEVRVPGGGHLVAEPPQPQVGAEERAPRVAGPRREVARVLDELPRDGVHVVGPHELRQQHVVDPGAAGHGAQPVVALGQQPTRVRVGAGAVQEGGAREVEARLKIRKLLGLRLGLRLRLRLRVKLRRKWLWLWLRLRLWLRRQILRW